MFEMEGQDSKQLLEILYFVKIGTTIFPTELEIPRIIEKHMIWGYGESFKIIGTEDIQHQ